MIHELTLWAVERKMKTVPPDILIANTEMTAAIGYVYKEVGINSRIEFNSPEELYNDYLNRKNNIDISEITEFCQNLIKVLDIYKVLPMVNETIEDLHIVFEMAYNSRG